MRAVVLANWVNFSGRLEGVVPWMYIDILGLVTTAIGNLIDPMGAALALPWLRLDGTPASAAEVEAEWRMIDAADCKLRSGAANCGWKGTGKVCFAHRGHKAAEQVAKLRLSPEGVSRVVLGKLMANEKELRKRFGDVYDDWNADALMFVHSISWACGAGFRFPLLAQALKDQDYVEALKHCHIDESGPDRINGTADDNWGLKPRNVANKAMLANAAKVQGFHLDPDALLYQVPGGTLVAPPATHVQVRQSTADLWEENTGSGGIVHPDIDWPSYRD